MDLEEIGSLIRNQRLSKNLSQKTISDHVRISRPNLSQLENGKVTEIGIRKVIEVLEQLGLELTVREANSRPTLRELAAERNKSAHSVNEQPVGKRVKRQPSAVPATSKENS